MPDIPERRSITIEPDLHKKIQSFRAFFLKHETEIDYTHVFNLLADYGFDELVKSGLSKDFLKRVDLMGDSTVESLHEAWLLWEKPSLRLNGMTVPKKSFETLGIRASARSEVKAPPKTHYCPKCRTKREMINAQDFVMKSGRRALKGLCATCHARMIAIVG